MSQAREDTKFSLIHGLPIRSRMRFFAIEQRALSFAKWVNQGEPVNSEGVLSPDERVE